MRVMLSFQVGSEVFSYSVLQCLVIVSFCSHVSKSMVGLPDDCQSRNLPTRNNHNE